MFEINGSELVAYSGSETCVTVPDSVRSIGDDAFLECSHITSVTLPEGVESIGKRAFWGCAALESISLPKSLRSIGDNAFRSCGALKQIVLEQGVVHIGEAAFRGCEQLERAVLPDSLEKLGISMFSDCLNLREVRLPQYITSISASCFHWCINLTQIQIPDSVTELENHAFSGCSSLSRVFLPEGLRSICEDCFSGCGRLVSLDVPQSVCFIGSNAFYKSGIEDSCDGDFIVLGRILVKYKGSGESAVVPENVGMIGNYAFAYCEQLKSVVLPEGVTHIGDYAFERCTALERVTLPSSLIQLGTDVFSECSSLMPFRLPQSLERLGSGLNETTAACLDRQADMTTAQGKYLIAWTGKAEKLELPDGIQVVADCAFVRCEGVRQIVFPHGLKTIGDSAMRWRSELKQITIPDTVRYIGANAFANCIEPLIVIDEPGGYLGENAFPDGTHLEMNISQHRVSVTLAHCVRAGECAERQMWDFVCDPSDRTFGAISDTRYLIPCAIGFFGSVDSCGEYLRENLTDAVCFAAQHQDISVLEQLLSYGLLSPEQLCLCIDYAVRNKLVHQQVVLMRCQHEHFGQTDTAHKRFEL